MVKGLLQGEDYYVTKPYDLNILSARVAAQLRRSGIMTAGKIELPPLTIDFISGEATLNGEQIPLTQKELQLLGWFELVSSGRNEYIFSKVRY